MRNKTVAAFLTCVFAVAVIGQSKNKPWQEWSDKEAERILNDSPWGQTQSDENISQMFYNPTNSGQTSQNTGTNRGGNVVSGNTRGTEAGLNQATIVKLRIRWLTARPIRQALARQTKLRTGQLPEQLIAFAESPPDNRVIIAVTFEANDQRLGNQTMQALNSANTGVLKNETYLERKDGKRIFLQEYVPPQNNSLGAALFIFPRVVDQLPILSTESGDVRFVSEFNKNLKLNMKYKVSDMIYANQLEY